MNYWQERALNTQERLSNKTIKQTEQQLKKYYSKTMHNCVGQFLQTYNAVLSSVNEGMQPTPADLYKLDSYWQMQAQMKAELQKLGDKQAVLFSERFTDMYQTVYNNIALQGTTAFNTVDRKTAEQMINLIWCADGKSWSQRIWNNTDKLQQALNDELIHCVVSGADTRQLKEMLMTEFNVSYNRADSLVRTEIAHIQTQAAQQRYEDAGIKEVYVWADKDERRCEVCGKLHNKRYLINEPMPIPAHPKCRCRILPVIE